MAKQMKELLGESAQIVKDRYEVLVSHPTANTAIRVLDGTTEKFKAKLIEDEVPVDPQTKINDVMANAFVSYSPSGTHSSDTYYYVNYGRKEDFELLKKQSGVTLQDSIVRDTFFNIKGYYSLWKNLPWT